MLRPLPRRILWRAITGAFWLMVPGILAILGLAPENVVYALVGGERAKETWHILANIDTDTARWIFVILSDVALVIGLVTILYIPS